VNKSSSCLPIIYFGQSSVRNWTNIVRVAADQYHTVGLKPDGTVVAAGPEVELAKWDLIETTP